MTMPVAIVFAVLSALSNAASAVLQRLAAVNRGIQAQLRLAGRD